MGIGNWLKRRFGGNEETGVSYILRRPNPEGRGMVKVLSLSEPVTAEEIYPTLDAGTYDLVKYKKGKSGFEKIWGPIEVTGSQAIVSKDSERAVQPRDPLGGLIDELDKVVKLRDNFKLAYNALGTLVGDKTTSEADVIDTMEKIKEKYNKLGNIFGNKESTTSQLSPPSYKGELPIWLHPDVLPKFFDGILDNFEKRAVRMGIIPSEKEAGDMHELIVLPPKPQKKEPEKKESGTEDKKYELGDKEEKEDESTGESGGS